MIQNVLTQFYIQKILHHMILLQQFKTQQLRLALLKSFKEDIIVKLKGELQNIVVAYSHLEILFTYIGLQKGLRTMWKIKNFLQSPSCTNNREIYAWGYFEEDCKEWYMNHSICWDENYFQLLFDAVHHLLLRKFKRR